MTHLETVKKIGVEIAAPNAHDVDQNARFPHEAIKALREAKLLGALVPERFGGLGLGLLEVAAMCETLGQYCSATAMVFAMHQIQVACIVRHASESPYFQGYMRELAERGLLIGSVTSEVGVGGSMRTSVSAIERSGDQFTLVKDATTVSYGEHCDDLLVTTRSGPDAAASDQVLVMARGSATKLEKTGSWDSLGMRGTCSPAMIVRTGGGADQILPVPFANISSQTMVPVAHIVWSSLWIGIAHGALSRAGAFVRAEARKKPGTVPPMALRLAEASSTLQTMRANAHDVARSAEELMTRGAVDALSSIAFALRIHNLKISTSELAVDVVHQALRICGIHGYKNDTKYSIGRFLRDAHSAALMVGNDRILATNASLLLVHKDD